MLKLKHTRHTSLASTIKPTIQPQNSPSTLQPPLCHSQPTRSLTVHAAPFLPATPLKHLYLDQQAPLTCEPRSKIQIRPPSHPRNHSVNTLRYFSSSPPVGLWHVCPTPTTYPVFAQTIATSPIFRKIPYSAFTAAPAHFWVARTWGRKSNGKLRKWRWGEALVHEAGSVWSLIVAESDKPRGLVTGWCIKIARE